MLSQDKSISNMNLILQAKEFAKNNEIKANDLFDFLKNLKKTDDIRNRLINFRDSIEPLSLTVINFMLSQDTSNTILILQAKEFASRLEKNNKIKTKELFDNIPICDNNTILDFFNKVVKIDIKNIRDEMDKFLFSSDCKFDDDIINIFNYMADQSDEDLNVIIHSFIKRNKGVIRNRISLKEHFNTYVMNLDNFYKEKITTQIHLTTDKKEKERLQKELKEIISNKKKSPENYNKYYKKIIISKMSKTDLDVVKNDNYYVQNLNSIEEEYKNAIKSLKNNKDYIENTTHRIATLNENIKGNKDVANDIKQKIKRIEQGEKIEVYQPNSDNPVYATVSDEKEQLKYFISEVEKYENELQILNKELTITQNAQNNLKKNMVYLKNDYQKVIQIKRKAESILKKLNDFIIDHNRLIEIFKKEPKKSGSESKNKINSLEEENIIYNNDVEIITKVLYRKPLRNVINYDTEIDDREIQDEIFKLYNKKVSIDLINQLYNEIQDLRAINEDDNNRFLEILDKMGDDEFDENASDYKIDSEEYKISGYIDSEKSQDIIGSSQDYYEKSPEKKKKIYNVNDPKLVEFTDEEREKYEEMAQKREENEAIIKELVNKSDVELKEMITEYNINLPVYLRDIVNTTKSYFGEKYRNIIIEIIIKHLRGITEKSNKLAGLYTEEDKERILYKKEQPKLYDVDDEKFIEFLKKIKDIDNDIELQNEVVMFFENIDDKKIQTILSLMITNYDVKTFSEFLRWFFEQRNDKDSYNFIGYYNKFAYIINEEKNKPEDDDEEEIEEDIIENLEGKELSELRGIYENKKNIAKKINVIFNPKMQNMTDKKMIKLIDTLNQLIYEKKEAIKLEETNYMAFNDHLKLRNFLLDLNLNDENDVSKKINEIMKSKFTAVVKNEKIYKTSEYFNMFNQILENMSISLLIEMIRGYLNQYKLSFMEYYSLFSKDLELKEKPQIVNEIRPYSLICDYMLSDNKICEEEFETYEKLEKHIKEVHLKNKIDKEIDEYKKMIYSGKLFNFINRPWIKHIIKKTFICEVPDETCVLNFNMYVKNIQTNSLIKFTDLDGNEWHQINKHFFDIETNDNISKKQEGDVLTFYGNKGIYKDKCLLRIKLGFKIIAKEEDDFIIQDENIFRNEQDYFENINTKLNETSVNKILDEPLKPDSYATKLGKSYISKVFDIIGTDYTYEDIFENINFENMTIRKYATYIFSICSYLDSELFDNIFRKRLVKKYYNPDQILNVNMNDKIPELLCNDSNFSNRVIVHMTYKMDKDIYQFGENLIIYSYYTKVEYERMDFSDEYIYAIPDKYNSLKNICKEFSSEIEDIEIYKEDDNEYCLNIKDLLKHIYNKENFDYFPEISNEFYDRIKTLYRKEIIDEKKDEKEKREYRLVYMIITDILDRTKDEYTFSQLNKMFLFDVEKEKDMNAEIEDIFKEIKEQEDEEDDDEDDEEDEEENEIDGKESKKEIDGKENEKEEESEKEIDGRDEYLDVIEEDEDEEDVKVDDEEDVKEDEDEDFNVMKKFYSIEPESTGSYICEYCDKICKQNERVNTIRFLDKKYKKFEIIKNICIKCLNDMDF